MDFFSKRSYRVAVALLVTMLLCHAEAIAGQLTLTWIDNANSEIGFSVERSTGSTGPFAEIGTTDAGVTQYTDSTVVDATTYCYRVRAFNASAYSGYTNVACGSTAQAFVLTVVEAGTGAGSVISEPSGIICGSSCSGTFASGTAVTLTATAETGSAFTGWSGGGCSGTGSCTVTSTAPTTVTATFSQNPWQTLTVSTSGKGDVESAPAGIGCGTTCSASYQTGTVLVLTATPAKNFIFTGWSGGCNGTGTCTVTLTSPTTVSATFANARRK